MDARALVTTLLEADEIDSKVLALRTEEPYWDAAVWALRAFLNHMQYIQTATLANYIRNITRDATYRFTLDDDDQAEISRMLMRAYQHERLGMKSSEIEMLKQRVLGESDEIDPKSFSSRLYSLDMRDLKHHIETRVPGVVAPVMHFLNGMAHGEGTHQDIYVYLAKEPVSASGFDPRHEVSRAEQQQADAVTREWLADHGCQVLDLRMINTNAMYKNVSPCRLNRYTFYTDKGVAITGHINDEPSALAGNP